MNKKPRKTSTASSRTKAPEAATLAPVTIYSTMITIIDTFAVRGAIRGEEMKSIGEFREYLQTLVSGMDETTKSVEGS